MPPLTDRPAAVVRAPVTLPPEQHRAALHGPVGAASPSIPATRGGISVTPMPSDSKAISATRGKNADEAGGKNEVATGGGNAAPARGRKRKTPEDSVRVDAVKASRGTWALRIRWTEEGGGRPVVYVSRLTDRLYDRITKRKRTYESFKKQLISSYLSRAVRSGDGPYARSGRAV